MKFNFMSLVVKDMERAREFYLELLDREPVRQDERLTIFDYDGMNFVLYDPEVDGYDMEDYHFGNNCLPAFEVEDLEKQRKRVEKLAEIRSSYELEDHRGFILQDSEGNIIEFYEMFE